MKKTIAILLAVVLTLCLGASAIAAVSANEGQAMTSAFVKLTTGGAVGYTYDTVSNFFGIPYGKADRFMMPQSADAWEGYKSFWNHAEVAPQGATTKGVFDTHNYDTNQVENEKLCLNLNVQSPDLTPDKLKPVVFWIHGGGFDTGSSLQFDLYDGSNLAKNGDVVFVSVNHRLNVLGYLDLSAYGEQFKNSGNVGMADIVLALEWVQDNIKAFGGDPENVTIVGQSGGGTKVTTLMGMPAARGLFHKAAALSGGSAKYARTTETAQADTEKVLAELGITKDNLDDILTIPYDTLFAAWKKVRAGSGPVVDGDYYPTGTYELSADIPLMCGSVQGEFSTNFGGLLMGHPATEEEWNSGTLTGMTDAQVDARLTQSFGKNAQTVKEAFLAAYPGHKAAEVLFTNNRSRMMNSDQLASAHQANGGKVYQYVQAYTYPMYGGIVPIHTASCIPFWFDNMDKIDMWVSGDRSGAQAVATAMSGSLASLAHTGSPSRSALKWDAWTPEADGIMVFDAREGVVSALRFHHDDKLLELMSAPK